MNKNSLIKAVTAARIFIARQKDLTEDDYKNMGISGNKRTGALRRASMELTRALADFRRSGN